MVETWQDEDMFRICDHGGMSLGLFAQRVSTGTPELTPRHEFRRAAERVSAFMCQQNFFHLCRNPMPVMSGELVC